MSKELTKKIYVLSHLGKKEEKTRWIKINLEKRLSYPQRH